MSSNLLTDADRMKTVEDMFDLAGASVSPAIGRLMPCDGGEYIDICDEKHTLGRSAELPLGYRIAHPRLSSIHCELILDKVTNRVYIVDKSTNGVFINGSRIKKGEKVELEAGDNVSLLNKAVATETKLEYLFQRLKKVVDSSTLVEELTCSICKSTLYKPCSAVPCLHTFCGGCISQWVKSGNTQCPECRADLYEVRPSHKVTNLVEELVKTRPDLQRTAEDIKEQEENNTIPPTGLRIKAGGKRDRDFDDIGGSDSEGSGMFDSDEEEEEDEEDYEFYHPHTAGPPGSVFFPSAHWGPKVPASCPQCSTPGPDGFQCPVGGSHLACTACRIPFPDRPLCTTPQRCFLCSAPFCDLYLGGCRNPNGVGMLQPVKDHKMDILPIGTLFNRNMVEQDILSKYLASAGIGPGTAWVECLRNFKEGTWKPAITSVRGVLDVDSHVCRPCCQRIFAALLVPYRRAIPSDALAPAVAARPDCWYGLECRTMHKNVIHAQKYNHVCATEKRKE